MARKQERDGRKRQEKGKRRRKEQDKSVTARGIRRIMILAGIFGVLTFVILFGKLWQLQIVQHEELSKKAVYQQTREVSSSANRGTIYDANGAILAISGSVQNVILSPRDVLATVEVEENDQFGNPRSQTVIQEEKLQKSQETSELIVEGLNAILGVSQDEIRSRLAQTESAYQIIAKKVSDEVAEQVRAFAVEHELTNCIYLTTDSKRYYPYSAMASQVIGFVNSENKGSYGLEALYDSELAGTDGRIVAAKNASGTQMLSNFETYTDAVEGYDIHTTIDSTIQMYAEKTLEEGIAKFEITNGAFCIVMEPKTGAVLALASYPDYDLNDPATVIDATELAKLGWYKRQRNITEEEYDAAVQEAQFAQWRNKALNDTYEPGSTFKPMVLAAALEEGVVNENSSFYCSGGVQIENWFIRCSARSGHGPQSLRKAVMNSCNPAFISIGQKLGSKKFYEYWEDFGFTSKTGIELPGEGDSYFWSKSEFLDPNSITHLAVASFGQRFTVTPMQNITALSCVVNGGHLMQPYVVQSVTDTNGNVVSYHEPTEIRQVISEETSAKVRDILESVVSGPNGTGNNAYVPGYRIGGKTGSSQNIDNVDHITVSFAGFAPADDPEIVVLLAYDWPRPAQHEGNTTAGGVYISGGNMAAPMAGELIANILNYLGYSKSSDSTVGVTVPDLRNSNLEEAGNSLWSLGLNYRTSGEGDVITDQVPAAGSSIPKNSSVVLYLGTQRAVETAEMPDLSGLTYDQAVAAMAERGLYLNATGTGEVGTVFKQTVDPGAVLDVGTVVEVQFADTVGIDELGTSWSEWKWANQDEQQEGQTEQGAGES